MIVSHQSADFFSFLWSLSLLGPFFFLFFSLWDPSSLLHSDSSES